MRAELHRGLTERGDALPVRQPVALRAIAASIMAISAAGGSVWAAPQSGVVRDGAATIRQSGSLTYIEQSSQRGVIDWRSFSIEANERVHFAHPAVSASTLNRVTGDQVSRIQGQLSANGRVILVNPNGIVFGNDARVDVGSLIATTSRLGDDKLPAYMQRGELQLEPGNPGAGILQNGTITATEGGLVALVAPHVRNNGFIQARLGRVTLAAGDTFTIDLNGDGLISLALSDAHVGRLVDADGKPVTALVEHTGQIDVQGGKAVLMTVDVAKSVVDNVIDMSGVILANTATVDSGGRIVLAHASGVQERSGSIVLDGKGGSTALSGQLRASGMESGQGGGSIDIAADALKLGATAYLDASVDASGAGQAGNVRLTGISAIARTEAEVISRALRAKTGPNGAGDIIALRSGSNVVVASNGSIDVNAAIDGRPEQAAPRAAGGALSLQARDDLILNHDVITGNGQMMLQSMRGAVVMRPQSTTLDGARRTPLVSAAEAPIKVNADGAIEVYELITGGDLALRSERGTVTLRAKLGYSNLGPLGSLTVSALSSTPNAHGQIDMPDVKVKTHGAIRLEAHRNVDVVAPGDGIRQVLRAGKLIVHSTLFGDLLASPLYLNNMAPGFSTPGPDGDWRTLADNGRGQRPTLTPPSPTANLPAAIPLDEIRLIAIPETPTALPSPWPQAGVAQSGRGLSAVTEVSDRLGTLVSPPQQHANAEIETDSSPAAMTDGTQGRSLADGEVVGPAVRAQRMERNDMLSEQVTAGLPSGGRGVAQDAELGRTARLAPARDVFERASHVVEAPVCDASIENAYFSSDAFGQPAAITCR
jgi:filamentous hemagglutinin family protein